MPVRFATRRLGIGKAARYYRIEIEMQCLEGDTSGYGLHGLDFCLCVFNFSDAAEFGSSTDLFRGSLGAV